MTRDVFTNVAKRHLWTVSPPILHPRRTEKATEKKGIFPCLTVYETIETVK